MDAITILGFLGGALTTASFFSQTIKTCRTRSTKDISLGMFIFLSIGILIWIIYGILIRSIPIIISNTVSFALTGVILIYKVKYK